MAQGVVRMVITPIISSSSLLTRSTVLTGWSLSGPITLLSATCILPVCSISSNTITPRASKVSRICWRTASSCSVS